MIGEAGLGVAFLTVFDFKHRCSVPLTGCLGGEGETGGSVLLVGSFHELDIAITG